MLRGRRERVMPIVPAFAESEYSKDPVVPALVISSEVLRAKEMTRRVDAPSNVLDEENTRKSPPQKTRDQGRLGWVESIGHNAWDDHRQQHPQRV